MYGREFKTNESATAAAAVRGGGGIAYFPTILSPTSEQNASLLS